MTTSGESYATEIAVAELEEAQQSEIARAAATRAESEYEEEERQAHNDHAALVQANLRLRDGSTLRDFDWGDEAALFGLIGTKVQVNVRDGKNVLKYAGALTGILTKNTILGVTTSVFLQNGPSEGIPLRASRTIILY